MFSYIFKETQNKGGKTPSSEIILSWMFFFKKKFLQ